MKKKYYSLLVLFLVCFLTQIVFPQSNSLKREFRGLWIATYGGYDFPPFPGVSSSTAKADLQLTLDYMVAGGFNAAIFQIRPEVDAFYESPYEPWSYWLTGSQGRSPTEFYDPLKFAIEEAHKRGLELHAWFNPYRIEMTIGTYTLHSSNISFQHPEWVLTVGTYKFLDPGLPQVRSYVTKIIVDVVTRYDIDAVHMDDYFYRGGINKEDSATYANNNPTGLNLGDWRRNNVNVLLKSLFDTVKALKPWVKFGMSPAGIWKNGIPAGTGGNDNYSVIYCDAVAWLSGQYIDYLAPQLYWAFGTGQDYGLLQTWWASQRNGRHIYPGLATYRIGEGTFGGAGEIANQIRYNRSTLNVQGSIQFRALNVRGNKGGIFNVLQSDIFYYPALCPVLEWKETIPPNAPQNLRIEPVTGQSYFALCWDAPIAASDGDTAVRYVVYRFPYASIQESDVANPKFLLHLTGQTTIIPSPRLDSANVQYYYAVSSLDRNNNESSLSNIITNPFPIATPTLVAPVDGEQNFAQNTQFQWKKVTGAMLYAVQLATSSNFELTSIINTIRVADTVLTVSGLLAQKIYYWRVNAGSQSNACSFSSGRSFKTGWPQVPILVSPVNAVGVTTKPTLTWTKGGGTSFQIQLGTSNLFTTGIVLDTTVADTILIMDRILKANTIHFWRVKAMNSLGTTEWSVSARFMTGAASFVEEISSIPTEYSLSQNFPNPFNPTSTIRFSVPKEGLVIIRLYDMLGRLVSELLNQELKAGTYTINIDGSQLPSGTYFYKMIAGGREFTKRMMLLK